MIENTVDDIFFVAGKWPVDETKPVVVFLHGSGGSHVLWDRQVAAIVPHANTIALDLPGHGKSRGDAKDSIEEIAAGVESFLASIQVTRPIVCGLSIGGAIALQLLINSSSDYLGGILINTGARLKVMPAIFETLKQDYDAAVEFTGKVAVSEKTDPRKVEPLIDAMKKCSPEAAINDFKACDAFDVMDRLNRISVPVLVMTAADDKLTPPKYGQYLAGKIPGSSLVQIPDAGHLSPLEKEVEVNQAIVDFLKGLTAG